MKIPAFKKVRPLYVVLVGLGFTAPLRSNAAGGNVVAWNSSGPIAVPAGLTNVIQIAAGYNHCLALTASGAVIAWGDNTFGQTNVPVSLTNALAIAGGSTHSLAVAADGTVVAWGDDSYGQIDVPPGLSNVVAVAGAQWASLALRADGTLVKWGYPYALDAWVLANITNVAAIAGDGLDLVALTASGQVMVWGDNTSGQASPPPGLSNVVAVAEGGSHSLALQADGTVVAWGNDGLGQIAVPASLANVQAIAGGWQYSLALRADGSIVAWGEFDFGLPVNPPSQGTFFAAAGPYSFGVAIQSDGSPAVTRPPVSQTVYSGTSAQFSVGVTGAATPSCQWQFNGSDISGATNLVLVITNAQSTDAGQYNARLSNAYGTTQSPAAMLSVLNMAPIFTLQPVSQAIPAGSNVTFAASVTGSVPAAFQWTFGGTNIPGATNAMLSLTNVQLGDAGNYAFVATNLYGFVSSSNATLTVVDLPAALSATNAAARNLAWTTGGDLPWIPEVTHTADGVAAAQCGPTVFGQSAWLSTTVSGPGTLNYWSQVAAYNGAYVSLLANGVGLLTNFGYSFWGLQTVYLPEGAQNVEWLFWANGSDMAYLSDVSYTPGASSPVVTVQPFDAQVSAGGYATFTAQAGGTPPLSYQWQLNGNNIDGATNTTWTVLDTQAATAGNYALVVTNAYGSTTSSNALLTVDPTKPVLLTMPLNQTSRFGANLSFSVSARGTEPLYYQWQANGTNLVGATNTVISFIDYLGLEDLGLRAVVSNSVGTVTTVTVRVTQQTPMAVRTLAGSTNSFGSADGTNNAARFYQDWDIVADSQKTLYVTDRNNHTIRRVQPVGTNWVTTTLAGLATFSGSSDGTNSSARFNQPAGIALDGAGNLYVADTYNNTIRKISPAGTNWVTSTLAGTPGPTGYKDGTNSAARFFWPTGVAVDSATNLYIVDWGNYSIRKMTQSGTNWIVTTVAGGGGTSGFINGTGTVARFYFPEHITMDRAGNFYIADTGNNAIRKMSAFGTNWVVSTLAGSGRAATVDGFSTNAAFNSPKGIAMDPYGYLYVSEALGYTIRRVSPGGAVTTVAGLAGTRGTSDGTNTVARFYQPSGLTTDQAGNVYIDDTYNNTVRMGGLAIAPYIMSQPQDQTVTAGDNVSFTVGVLSPSPAAYQWQYQGADLPGATNNPLMLTNVSVSQAGAYSVAISNLYGAVHSVPANLTVLRSVPQFDSLPQFTTNGLGMSLSGLSGHGDIIIFSSADLATWVPVLTNAPVTGSLRFSVAVSPDSPAQFYRALEQ